MAKFKAGDRVVYVGGKPSFDKSMVGRTGRVTEDLGGVIVSVDWEGWKYGVYRENIELVVAPATSAVRTVTRREIVPGVYGAVTVERIPFGGLEIRYQSYGNAVKLREAARIFNEIADVLDEQKKEVA